MKRTSPTQTKIFNLLKELLVDGNPIAYHLSLILADYEFIENIPDKELLFLLNKYRATKELDISIQHDSSIDRIIREGMNLDTLLAEEEEEI